MNGPFFYFRDLASAGNTARIEGEEAQHAAGARRLRVGDALTLFDGQGLTAEATLTTIADRGRTIEVRVGARVTQPAQLPALHLAAALPKGDRLAVLLDMATQLGMSSFTPLDCTHSVVHPNEANHARMQRLLLEASKQSRRAWLPQLHAPASPVEAAARATRNSGLALLAHPGGKPLAAQVATADQPITLLIGPEGGFTEEEVRQALAAGARMVALGDAILRIETAAVAVIAAFRLGRAAP